MDKRYAEQGRCSKVALPQKCQKKTERTGYRENEGWAKGGMFGGLTPISKWSEIHTESTDGQ